MIEQIFGIPLYKTNIGSNLYDKEGILNTIFKNYEKSNERILEAIQMAWIDERED